MPRPTRTASLPLAFAFALLGALAPACSGGGDDPADEICDNGLDDDGDGAPDCDDDACADHPFCTEPPIETRCGDGLDEDGDGRTDCDDADCVGHPECRTPDEACGNGLDDDGDGDTDCDDAECAADPDCRPVGWEAECDDGLDDDRDGDTDCDDADCAGHPACLPAAENCTDGLDNDGDGVTDCDDADCAPDPVCTPAYEACDNDRDDDGDGDADCDDADCAAHPDCAGTCDDARDAHEDNDDLAAAVSLADLAPGDLLIAADGDIDVFSLPVCRGGRLAVTVRFVHARGDVDAQLVAADGAVLAVGDSPDDDERLEWTGDRLGEVYLVVRMYTAGGCNPYTVESTLDDAACIWSEPDCGNGEDDDGDGLTDCADGDDCGTEALCLPEGDCADGLDDDGDGAADCADWGCAESDACRVAGNDGCAAAFALPPDPVGTWHGSTAAAAADHRGTCAGAGRDVIFRVTLTARAVLTAVTAGSDFDTVLYLRAGDCATGAERACNDDVARGDVSSRIAVALDPGTYHLFVDGYDSRAAGDYRLTLALGDAEVCTGGLDEDGDGDVDCDDPDCAAAAACIETLCADGLDDDGDGDTDCDDADCAAGPLCVEAACGNTLDDDRDGLTDCADLDCALAAGCYPAACAEDTHEPNDDRASALPITSITPTEYLAVTPSDDDYWSVPVCAGAVVTAFARFRHADGDVDIYLYNASGTRLATGGSATDDELITWTAGSEGTVYLRVDLYGSSDPCNLYRLAVAVDRSACP